MKAFPFLQSLQKNPPFFKWEDSANYAAFFPILKGERKLQRKVANDGQITDGSANPARAQGKRTAH
ncbi:hypothetical protein GCM10007416_13520 [Kroppenstedtia guangzhouensis]|uniref:Uncharacterized protein n=1 Tax=Kroppenstedtia guangzhouensis TaxID=1274356 RepID=A0ABQ1GEA3_9BACL|nr:hypothetical protein GCM10007416_13520 [Kroppenstedtia guangzhouensis]